jgi:hypothetical protein
MTAIHGLERFISAGGDGRKTPANPNLIFV